MYIYMFVCVCVVYIEKERDNFNCDYKRPYYPSLGTSVKRRRWRGWNRKANTLRGRHPSSQEWWRSSGACVPVNTTSLYLFLTHISCDNQRQEEEGEGEREGERERERERERARAAGTHHVSRLGALHWSLSLLCLMGARGPPGLVGQMGRELPGPI